VLASEKLKFQGKNIAEKNNGQISFPKEKRRRREKLRFSSIIGK